MPDIRPILFVVGLLLCVLSGAMLAPAAMDVVAANPDWKVFVTAAGLAAFVGGALMLTFRSLRGFSLDLRQAFLLTTLSWIALAAFAAMPFLFFSGRLDYADAFFEAISGLTTTGSTILVGLDRMPPGILLWRSLLQWLGGIGIIVMAIALLPFLRVGGMQLFRTESSERSDKALPRAGQIAIATVTIYTALTVLCALAYHATGMTPFEATAHAMTTLSTGGYSTSDQSIGHFGPAAHWVGVLFMILGGLPFVLYIYLVKRQPGRFWASSQVRTFFSILCLTILAMTLWLFIAGDRPLLEAVRLAAFNVTSILTTTGYATSDYGVWGSFAVVIFFLITFFGACAGSTTGGIKTVRLEILFLVARHILHRLVEPHRVDPLKYEGRPVEPDVPTSVTVFVYTFLIAFIALALALAATGLDFVTATSGAATALANVGPGLGEIIGPAGNFSALPDSAKWLLSAGMLLGRLELFTVLVLFQRGFWAW